MDSIDGRRGYVRAAVVAFLFILGAAVGGAAVMARWGPRAYRSSGLLRLPGVVPGVMQPDSARLNYPLLMASQTHLIKSRRIADTAVMDPLWKNSRVVAPTVDELLRHLDARRLDGSEVI